MTSWQERMMRMLTWRGALPSRFGLERIYIHLSALIALPLAAVALLLLSTSPNYYELRTTAITLPLVWIASVMLRVAAQVLAIGSHGDEFEMVIGPAGNISNDYQHLSGPAMLSYAAAGQSATLLLTLLGLLVVGALVPAPETGATFAQIIDFHSGWGSNAWASQFVWLNAFLFVMHLLPAAPFDTRALVVGWCHVSRPNLTSWRIHRLLASIDSHLSAALAGCALTMIATRLATGNPAFSWYALLFVSMYLLTFSQVELFQAQQEEEFAEPPLPRSWKQRDPASSVNLQRQSKLTGEYETLGAFADVADSAHGPEGLDIDEILRKLHREGQDSLSAFEKEALLIASRELQARRQPPN